jgi:hypothetical protein
MLVPVAWIPYADRGVAAGRREPVAARAFCQVPGWIGAGKTEAALPRAGNVGF